MGLKKILHIKFIFVILLAVFVPLLTAFLVSNLFITVGVGIISVSLATLSIFLALKPLDGILKGSKILASGNLSYRIDVRSQDELEEVATSFNFLAQTLKNAVENLETDKSILSSEKNKLSMILSSIIDGIVAIDGQKNVVLVNKAFEQMCGFTQPELAGKPIDQLVHMFSDKTEIDPKTYCETTFVQSLTMIGKNGKQVKINLVSSPIAEGVQTNLSCILILHDLTHDEDLEKMKLDFVSMASHELKTPLTAIKGYLSVFMEENKTRVPPDEMELLERAEDSVTQLYLLVENLLNVNRIERDQMEVKIDSIDYYAILEKAILDLQNQAKQKNITLTLDSPSDLPKVMADPLRVVEIINNLVSNAIHYTNPNGSVTVSIKVNPEEIITCVEDTGVGIPKEALPHLFSKFFRVSSNLLSAEKGTGLGLYISKSIVEKLGGRIWVESETNKGSKFYFSLPIASTDSLHRIDSQKFLQESIETAHHFS